MKRCLVLLQEPEQAHAVLATTAYLVTTLDLQAVEVMALRPPVTEAAQAVAPETAFLYEEQQRSRVAALHACFCLWLQTEYQHDQTQFEAISVTWHDGDGTAADSLQQSAQSADLIIAVMPCGPVHMAERSDLTSLVFQAGCPVLLVPEDWEGACGRSVLVVWAEGVAADGLIKASAPFLKTAQRISSLLAVEENLPAGFEEATTTRVPLPLSEQNAGSVIAVEAQKQHVDLVVFGLNAAQQDGSATIMAEVVARATTPFLLWGDG